MVPQTRSPLRSAPRMKTASATEPIQLDHLFLGASQSVSSSLPVLFWMVAYLKAVCQLASGGNGSPFTHSPMMMGCPSAQLSNRSNCDTE